MTKFFAASIVLAAASLVAAQGINVDSASISQCANSAINFSGGSGPYYVAVVPAENPCGGDSLAEFYDVYENTVNYYGNIPEGTQLQVYVEDSTGAEYWSSVITVGGGDSACISGATPTTTSSSAAYTPPPPSTLSLSNDVDNDSEETDDSADVQDETPENAAPETSGAGSVTASIAALGLGAVTAFVALL